MSEREIQWSISDVKTTEGETMIVGGKGQEFGLIATVTDEADAKQIIADREARTGAPAAPAPENDRHYLAAIRQRLEKLYEEHPNDARLRQQISDECDWIDAALAVPPARSAASTVEPVAYRQRLIVPSPEPGDWSYYNHKPSPHRRYETQPLYAAPTTSPEPDWKQDQAETSRLPRNREASSEPDAVREALARCYLAGCGLNNAKIDDQRSANGAHWVVALSVAGVHMPALSRPAHGGWEDNEKKLVAALRDSTSLMDDLTASYIPGSAPNLRDDKRREEQIAENRELLDVLSRNHGQGGGPRS